MREMWCHATMELKYASINVYFVMRFTVFSNTLKDTQIHILADSDEHEVVQQVQVLS